MLASSLQIAYNLKILPELMHNLISDLIQGMEDHVRAAFDISKLSKDALAKGKEIILENHASPQACIEAANTTQSSSAYKSRIRTEPTNITAPQWTTMLWDRLEALLEDLTDCCIKVLLA